MFRDSVVQSWIRVMCSVLMVSVGTVSVRAAGGDNDLARVVPADTLLYLGWSGSGSDGSASGKESAGNESAGVLGHPQVRAFLADVRKAVRGWANGPGAEFVPPAVYQSVEGLLSAVWEEPCALAVFDFGMTPFGPGVEAALIVRDKGGKRQLGERVGSLIQLAGLPSPVEVKSQGGSLFKVMVPIPGGIAYTTIGDHFVLAVGEQSAGKIAAVVKGGASLASSDDIQELRDRIHSSDERRTQMMMIDIARIREKVDALLPMFAGEDEEFIDQYRDFLRVSGLADIRYIFGESWREAAGFKSHWHFRTHETAGLAAKGYLGDPVGDSLLRRIPKEVSWASAANVVPIVFSTQTIREQLQIRDGEVAAMYAEGLAYVKRTLGVDIEEDVLDQFGESFIFYDAPADGGVLFTGISMHAKVKDHKRLFAAIEKLVQWMNDNPDIPIEGEFRTSSYRGKDIRYVNITGLPIPIAPAMTVHDGWLMAGLFPQIVRSSIDRAMDNFPRENSLLENKDFQRGRALVSPLGASMYYVDTKLGISQLYPLVLPAVQAGLAMGQKFGFDMDISSIPSSRAVTEALFGDVYTMRKETNGTTIVSHGLLPMPVPAMGGTGAVTGLGAVAVTALLVSILLPSLSRARELSKRLVSQQNLKEIGLACRRYATENEGKYPPDLQTLVKEELLAEESLRSPKHEPGRDCYVYIPGFGVNESRPKIIAHERLDMNGGEGVNVLYSDGHAEFLRSPQFDRSMEQQRPGE